MIARLKRSWLARAIRTFRNHIVYRLGFGLPVARETWNSQYEKGEWRLLENSSERSHYEAIAEFQTNFCATPAVLDVGCGPGVTRSFLQIARTTDYVGIDVSEEAIAQALSRYPDGQFYCADAEKPAFAQKFGTIVFNEVLYYFSRPCDIVAQYLNFLDPDGIVIVSMCRYPGHDAIWKKLSILLNVAGTKVCNAEDGRQWTVKVFHVRK